MKTVGIFEAKTKFSEIVTLVENGESVIVTRRGKAILQMNPIAQDREAGVREAAQELLKMRQENKLNGLTIRELIDEGRRF